MGVFKLMYVEECSDAWKHGESSTFKTMNRCFKIFFAKEGRDFFYLFFLKSLIMKSGIVKHLLLISLLEISRADHQRMKRSVGVIADIFSVQPRRCVLLRRVINYVVTARLTSLTMGGGVLFLIKPGILLYLAFYSKLRYMESRSLTTTQLHIGTHLHTRIDTNG